MKIDELIEKIIKTNNPCCVGLDTDLSYLPEKMKKDSLYDAAQSILEFNIRIIESIKDIVPCVKIQVAYYELLGIEGLKAFYETNLYAKKQGLITILDVKRGDIGSTADAYSRAFLQGIDLNGNKECGFDADFITINGYLGSDGIKPFVNGCAQSGKGIFALVKTSNPSSAQLQDRRYEDGQTLYGAMGELISGLGEELIGKSGFSSVGAVVGATHPKQSAELRKQLPNTFFLVPGYGAQGATANDLMPCFNLHGLGAIVNSSRGIICAYKQAQYSGLNYYEAARSAAIMMRDDINLALKGR